MVKYSKVNVKLTDTQLKKLNTVKNKTGATHIILSEAQISRIIQSGRFLGSLLS